MTVGGKRQKMEGPKAGVLKSSEGVRLAGVE